MQRPSFLGCQGHPSQFGLLHAQEGPVRRALAFLPPGMDRVCCPLPGACVEFLGRPQDVSVWGALAILLGGHQALQGGPHHLQRPIRGQAGVG